MLIMRAPLKPKSLSPVRCFLGRSMEERISANYSQIQAQYTPEDLFHMVSQPAEIYLEEGASSSLTSRTVIRNKQEVKLTLVCNLLNRLFASGEESYTYQDRVYIQNMLQKLGVRDVGEFMRQVRALKEDTETMQGLLRLYRENMQPLKEAVTDVQREQEASLNPAHDGRRPERYLHQAILERLGTDRIYERVRETYRPIPAAEQTITRQEIALSEQSRTAAGLGLQNAENAVLGKNAPAMFRRTNIYEEGAGLDAESSKETIMQELSRALLLNLTDSLYQLRGDGGRNAWYEWNGGMEKIAENTLERFLSIQNGEQEPGKTAKSREAYQERLNRARRQELSQLQRVAEQLKKEEAAAPAKAFDRGGEIYGGFEAEELVQRRTEEPEAYDMDSRERLTSGEALGNASRELGEEEAMLRRNRELFEEIQEREQKLPQVRSISIDRRRAKRDVLRALENPQEVIREYLSSATKLEQIEAQRDEILRDTISEETKELLSRVEELRPGSVPGIDRIRENKAQSETAEFAHREKPAKADGASEDAAQGETLKSELYRELQKAADSLVSSDGAEESRSLIRESAARQLRSLRARGEEKRLSQVEKLREQTERVWKTLSNGEDSPGSEELLLLEERLAQMEHFTQAAEERLAGDGQERAADAKRSYAEMLTEELKIREEYERLLKETREAVARIERGGNQGRADWRGETERNRVRESGDQKDANRRGEAERSAAMNYIQETGETERSEVMKHHREAGEPGGEYRRGEADKAERANRQGEAGEPGGGYRRGEADKAERANRQGETGEPGGEYRRGEADKAQRANRREETGETERMSRRESAGERIAEPEGRTGTWEEAAGEEKENRRRESASRGEEAGASGNTELREAVGRLTGNQRGDRADWQKSTEYNEAAGAFESVSRGGALNESEAAETLRTDGRGGENNDLRGADGREELRSEERASRGEAADRWKIGQPEAEGFRGAEEDSESRGLLEELDARIAENSSEREQWQALYQNMEALEQGIHQMRQASLTNGEEPKEEPLEILRRTMRETEHWNRYWEEKKLPVGGQLPIQLLHRELLETAEELYRQEHMPEAAEDIHGQRRIPAEPEHTRRQRSIPERAENALLRGTASDGSDGEHSEAKALLEQLKRELSGSGALSVDFAERGQQNTDAQNAPMRPEEKLRLAEQLREIQQSAEALLTQGMTECADGIEQSAERGTEITPTERILDTRGMADTAPEPGEQRPEQTEAMRREVRELWSEQSEAVRREVRELRQEQTEAARRQTRERQEERPQTEKRRAEERCTEQAEAAKRRAEEQRTGQAEAAKQRAEERRTEQAEAAERRAEEQRTGQAEAAKQRAGERRTEQAEAAERRAREQRIEQAERAKRQVEEWRAEPAEAVKRQTEEWYIEPVEAVKRQAGEWHTEPAEAAKSQAEEQRAGQVEAAKRRTEERHPEQNGAAERRAMEQRIERAEAAERRTVEQSIEQIEAAGRRTVEQSIEQAERAKRQAEEWHLEQTEAEAQRTGQTEAAKHRTEEQYSEQTGAARRAAEEWRTGQTEASERQSDQLSGAGREMEQLPGGQTEEEALIRADASFAENVAKAQSSLLAKRSSGEAELRAESEPLSMEHRAESLFQEWEEEAESPWTEENPALQKRQSGETARRMEAQTGEAKGSVPGEPGGGARLPSGAEARAGDTGSAAGGAQQPGTGQELPGAAQGRTSLPADSLREAAQELDAAIGNTSYQTAQRPAENPAGAELHLAGRGGEPEPDAASDGRTAASESNPVPEAARVRETLKELEILRRRLEREAYGESLQDEKHTADAVSEARAFSSVLRTLGEELNGESLTDAKTPEAKRRREQVLSRLGRVQNELWSSFAKEEPAVSIQEHRLTPDFYESLSEHENSLRSPEKLTALAQELSAADPAVSGVIQEKLTELKTIQQRFSEECIPTEQENASMILRRGEETAGYETDRRAEKAPDGAYQRERRRLQAQIENRQDYQRTLKELLLELRRSRGEGAGSRLSPADFTHISAGAGGESPDLQAALRSAVSGGELAINRERAQRGQDKKAEHKRSVLRNELERTIERLEQENHIWITFVQDMEGTERAAERLTKARGTQHTDSLRQLVQKLSSWNSRSQSMPEILRQPAGLLIDRVYEAVQTAKAGQENGGSGAARAGGRALAPQVKRAVLEYLQTARTADEPQEEQKAIQKTARQTGREQLAKAVQREVLRKGTGGRGAQAAETVFARQPELSLIHKPEASGFSEAVLEELRAQRQSRQQAKPQKEEIITQSVSSKRSIEIPIEGAKSREQARINDMISAGIQRQLGSISDKVYAKLEKRLSSDRKRRGY